MTPSTGVLEIIEALISLHSLAEGAHPAVHSSHSDKLGMSGAMARIRELHLSEDPHSDVSVIMARMRELHCAGDPHTKLAAAIVLADLAGDGRLLMGTLLESLRNPDESIRSAAMLAIGNMGPLAAEGAQQLVESLACPETRVGAAAAISSVGTACVPFLLSALRSADREARIAIVRVLGEFCHTEESCRYALKLCLSDTDPDVRLASMVEINTHKLGHADVAQLLRDEDYRVRDQALTLVQRGQNDSEKKVGILVACLKDDNPRIRSHAAHALGQLGTAARVALTPLVELLDD